jgi:hypothetical protein
LSALLERRLCVGSRNRQLSCGDNIEDPFRGLVDYVRNHAGICGLLEAAPHLHLHGEWLVHHTVNYPIHAYNHLYIFDVYDSAAERYLTVDEYWPMMDRNGILCLTPLAVLDNPTFEQLKGYVGKTRFDIPAGEGIVVKNYDFINRFGHCVYGKLVREDFKEVNHLMFTASKFDETETRIVSQYVTEARVRKQMVKLIDSNPAEQLEMRHIPQVMGLVYHDLITEDIWDILKRFKNPTLDFGKLKRQCDAASKGYFIGILTEAKAS